MTRWIKRCNGGPAVVVAVLLSFPSIVSAQSWRSTSRSVNPGIRLGYTFGSGVVLGVEVSMAWSPLAHGYSHYSLDRPNPGFVVAAEWVFGESMFRATIKGQVSFLFLGATLGPTLALNEQGVMGGFETSGFLSFGYGALDGANGVLASGYFRYTLLSEIGSLYDTGGILKLFFVNGCIMGCS